MKLNVVASVFVLATIISPFVPTQTVSARSLRSCDTTWVSAHRGETNSNATENTSSAFRLAIARGAKAIETDLRLTSDGQWVLMHDSTINRTTRGSGYVSKMTLAQLTSISSDSGDKILSFDQFVAEMPAGMKYQLEFKVVPNDEQMQYVIDKMRVKTGTDIDPANASAVFYTSRHTSTLQRLSVAAPEHQRGLIMGQKNRIAASSIPSYVDSINIHKDVATKAYIQSVHNRGKQVLARSADSSTAWRTLTYHNVDRIVTDNITGYTRWCRNYQ